MKEITLLFASILLTGTVHAGVLTVDPANGPYTTIASAVNAAQPGDVVQITGGRYHEAVSVGVSGEAGKPVTIQPVPGQSVVMDGSLPLTGWTGCTSADEVKGNTNYNNIYWVDTPTGIPFTVINVYEGDSILAMSRYPDVVDPYFDRLHAEFMTAPNAVFTTSTIVDPDFLNQTEDNYWRYSTLLIHAGANAVYAQRILSSSAAENKITFAELPSIYSDNDKYSIANHPSLISGPGQFYYDEMGRKLYVWPRAVPSLEDSSITITKKPQAFYISGKDHITIRDITMRRFSNNCIYIRGGSTNIQVKGCTVTQGVTASGDAAVFAHTGTNILVDSCVIDHNKYNKGVVFQNGQDNILSRCSLIRNGATCVDFYTETNSSMIGNYLSGHVAIHANGLTLYESCRNCLLEGNEIYDGWSALTFQNINGLTCINNIFTSPLTWPVACWGSSDAQNVTFYHNLLTGTANTRGFFSFGDLVNFQFKNNICDGMNALAGDISHNLYINDYGSQGTLQTGEISDTDLAAVFNDYAGRDFTLKAGSPAIDAGTDVDVTTDFNGLMRPYNGAPDMGPHEYGSYVHIQVRGQEGGQPEYLVLTGNPLRAGDPLTVSLQGRELPRRIGIYRLDGHEVLGQDVIDGQPFVRWEHTRALKPGTYLLQAGDHTVQTIQFVE